VLNRIARFFLSVQHHHDEHLTPRLAALFCSLHFSLQSGSVRCGRCLIFHHRQRQRQLHLQYPTASTQHIVASGPESALASASAPVFGLASEQWTVLWANTYMPMAITNVHYIGPHVRS